MTFNEIKIAFGVDDKGAREFLYQSDFSRYAKTLGPIRVFCIRGVWHLDQKPSSKKAIQRAYMAYKMANGNKKRKRKCV